MEGNYCVIEVKRVNDMLTGSVILDSIEKSIAKSIARYRNRFSKVDNFFYACAHDSLEYQMSY